MCLALCTTSQLWFMKNWVMKYLIAMHISSSSFNGTKMKPSLAILKRSCKYPVVRCVLCKNILYWRCNSGIHRRYLWITAKGYVHTQIFFFRPPEFVYFPLCKICPCHPFLTITSTAFAIYFMLALIVLRAGERKTVGFYVHW